MVLNNRDYNIYHNNRDYDFCHNRAALLAQVLRNPIHLYSLGLNRAQIDKQY